jgi:hypothetical protein
MRQSGNISSRVLSQRSKPSSTSVAIIVAFIGLVTEPMWNLSSRVIASFAPSRRTPKAAAATGMPRRETSATAPG